MSKFDFVESAAPAAAPLQHSHAASQIENELKGVFLDLFARLSEQTFDANVLGAAHLGSFDLVRQMVNHDGLILLPGDREEAATRYLYRAWKSGDIQKRGLHFVRTYLQLLFPGQTEVRQMWHAKDQPYGTAFILNEPRNPYWYHFLGKQGLTLDGTWKVGRPLALDNIEIPSHTPDEAELFLTSRIEILLGLEAIAEGKNPVSMPDRPATTGLLEVIRAVIPARLVPMFRFWLRFVLSIQLRADYRMLMEKRSRLRYPWCGRVISDQTDVKWRLGRDGDMVKLGLPLGSFRLGELRGGISRWRLKPCRIDSATAMESRADTLFHPLPRLGQADRRLNGGWALSRPQLDTLSHASMTKAIDVAHQTGTSVTFHEHYATRFPCQPERLGRQWRLGEGWRLGGGLRLSAGVTGSKLGSFRLRRDHIAVESSLAGHIASNAQARATIRLPRQTITKLRRWDRALDGSWPLGAITRLGRFRLDGERLRNRKMQQSYALGGFKLSPDEFSGLGISDTGTAVRRPLNGGWKLGQVAHPEFMLTITRV